MDVSRSLMSTFDKSQMIAYSESKPPPSLSPFVECIWSLKTPSKISAKRELIIPGGRVEMIFTADTSVRWIDSKAPIVAHAYTGSYLLGPRNRHFFVEMCGHVNMIGVRFKHGALAPFSAVPLHLLLNQVISLDQIFDRKINSLAGQLFEKENDTHHVSLIEKFLLTVIQCDSDTLNMIRLISSVKNQQQTSVSTLSDLTGMHYKKLERTFSKFTGYSPKNFGRVIRFYEALRQSQNKSESLTHIGLNNGYYDQPHFIRDFKAFTGKSPTQFDYEKPTIANLLLQSKYV